MSAVITVESGNLAIGRRPVLRGIDFSVQSGEVVAVLGGNGSGKSTLVRGLMRLIKWSSGDIRLFDTPLARFRDWHRVGYVPQQLAATSGVPATVMEVVSSGRLSRRRLLLPMSQADRTAVRDAIATVELTDRRQDAVSQLSGGQQQRVLIARALAGEPELLVLDEPNAGVDHHNQLGLAHALAHFVEAGATVVVVLHELGPLTELIDRVVLLQDGRIAYDGPPVHHTALELVSEHTHAHHRPPSHPDHVPLEAGWQL
ncbi:MAG: ATP-binding cassette domain-containing protein [Nocardioidaceae bacterium]|nr:ATP-binding cassette domain-containing protein [Nocardioidaceae bacterium]